MAPKKASGYQNRKRKLEQQLQVEKCPKISSFFKSIMNEQNPNLTFESKFEDRFNEINDFNNSSSNDEECSNIPNILPNDPKNIDESFDVIISSKNFNDIAYWPEQLTSTDKDYLITTGPKMSIDYMKNFNFPKDNNYRSFSYSLFFRTISNGEKYLRKWLVYSETVNAVFCFFCKIFDPTSRSNLAKDGLKDRKHVPTRVFKNTR